MKSASSCVQYRSMLSPLVFVALVAAMPGKVSSHLRCQCPWIGGSWTTLTRQPEEKTCLNVSQRVSTRLTQRVSTCLNVSRQLEPLLAAPCLNGDEAAVS